ncbi:MAG: hypothetical protein IJV40_08000 [Oscillospiraceae bacterium]|nr:hypothetical protein [Oscillospiraceae bacterium]
MTEQIIVCAFLAAYAVLVDLTAATLRSQGDIYQTGPMTVWGAIISAVAVVQILLVFRARIRKEAGRLKSRVRKK